MADLPTNFLDDILSDSMGGKRRFKITRLDGTSEEVTIEDISKYDQVGSAFGAGDINKTNQTVNEKFDSGDVVDPMETTEPGFAADAYQTKLQFDEQNKNLGGFTPIIDDTGKITGYKTNVGGADTVFPFKGGEISVASLIIGKYAGGNSVSTHASTNDTELFTTKSQESASSGYVTVNKSCHAKLFVIATQRGASAKTKVKLNGTEIFSGSAYTNGYQQDIDLVAGDKLTVTVEKPDTTYAAFGFYIVCI